jgi:hypothetical protein
MKQRQVVFLWHTFDMPEDGCSAINTGSVPGAASIKPDHDFAIDGVIRSRKRGAGSADAC